MHPADNRGRYAKVGGDADVYPATGDAIADRIEGIVRQRKWKQRKRADREGIGHHEALPAFRWNVLHGPSCLRVGIEGHAQQHMQPPSPRKHGRHARG